MGAATQPGDPVDSILTSAHPARRAGPGSSFTVTARCGLGLPATVSGAACYEQVSSISVSAAFSVSVTNRPWTYLTSVQARE
ncbi:hypothetical protein TR51_00015 [Kitasatospora griseola]|uniref:Uncharacterized protein n=1 Tax=Kitasatospora griseola TaxID=2064 RepID=A0A0D0Q0V5_KITGR|nr:hypothetical protein TR51_00015 [Kitasatospora griseola]